MWTELVRNCVGQVPCLRGIGGGEDKYNLQRRRAIRVSSRKASSQNGGEVYLLGSLQGNEPQEGIQASIAL